MNVHKGSKTLKKNKLGKTKKTKKQFSETLGWTPLLRKTKKTPWKNQKNNSQRLLAGHPPFLKTSPELFFLTVVWFFGFPNVFLVFWFFLGCYWFSRSF